MPYPTFAQHDTVPGTYPAALARQVNVGNTVAVGGNVNSIINSGESTPADVIRDTPSGFSNPTVNLINTAEFHLTPTSNTVQVDALAVIPGNASTNAVVQLDNNKISTDGAGKLTALKLVPDAARLATDGSGKIILDNTAVNSETPGLLWIEAVAGGGSGNVDLTLNNSTGGWIKLTPNVGAGGQVDLGKIRGDGGTFQTDGSGHLTTKGYTGANGGQVKGWSYFSASGSGTVNHGLGATPSYISIEENVVGSSTTGVNTVTSTQCTVNMGGNQAIPFWALAMN